jgi:hypothetical protein
VTRHVYSYSPEGRYQLDQWLRKPVPVDFPFDVWLQYPASDVSVFAGVEPMLGGHSLVAYTVRQFDGRSVKRSAIWHYVDGEGLGVVADSEYVSEAFRVATQILGAIYEGDHQEIEDSFPVSSAAVH